MSAAPAPQSTKPAANAGNDGSRTHSANAAAVSTPERASRRRRENASAHAPEGTSRTTPVSDQTTNSAEIAASDRPWSRKSSGYSG